MHAFPTTKKIRSQLGIGLDGPQKTALIVEAASLETPPNRLAELARSSDPFVQVAACKNPNLTTDALFNAMFG